jgi:hypothetical protein
MSWVSWIAFVDTRKALAFESIDCTCLRTLQSRLTSRATALNFFTSRPNITCEIVEKHGQLQSSSNDSGEAGKNTNFCHDADVFGHSASFGEPALPDKYRKKKAIKERLNDNWAEVKEVIGRGIQHIESREGCEVR